MQAYQHTLASPASFAGVGIHTGIEAHVTIRPAPADAGVVFVRTDVSGDNRIAAHGLVVSATQLGTVIANSSGVKVSTVEHLLAAFSALGVDNAVVELDGLEVPIMDGSSRDFVAVLDAAGLKAQDAPRRYLEILEPVEFVEGDKRASLSPCGRFEVAFEIDFASAAIGRQRVEVVCDEAGFRRELADCRTFGFLAEVEQLRAAGFARGGSLENVVVIDADGTILNPEGLRRPDEFVRHKALDAVGDLYLLGAPLLGRFEGLYAGHALNNALVRAVLAKPDAWRWTMLPQAAETV